MTTIVTWEKIKPVLERANVLKVMKTAFIAHDNGDSIIPPVGELCFRDPPGDVHIKYGAIRGGDHYVVKIASGFYKNPDIGLPSSQGMMLLFCQKTGQLSCILLDEGKLTDARTGATGALAAKTFANKEINQIGIVGAGIQAREQAHHLLAATTCRCLKVWARKPERAKLTANDLCKKGYNATHEKSLERLTSESDLIITTTPSTSALIQANWVGPGTTIVAVGADGPHKQELESALLQKAQRIISDCPKQALNRGEIFRAMRDGCLNMTDVISFGSVLAGKKQGRMNPEDIIIVDLTGVAVQDLAIAQAIHQSLRSP